MGRWPLPRAGEPVPSPDDQDQDHDANSSVTTDRNEPATSKPATSMADTLTITDNRTGKQYELPDQGRRDPRHRPRQIKTGAKDDSG